MAADSPAVCAVYAERAKLLDTKGWKQFRRLAKRSRVLTRQLNQAKLASYRTAPLFKFGYQVPRHHKEAITLDERNSNTKYCDAENWNYLSMLITPRSRTLERGALVRKDTRRSEYTLCTTSSMTGLTKLVSWLEDTSSMFLPRVYTPALSRSTACASVSSLPSSMVSKSVRPTLVTRTLKPKPRKRFTSLVDLVLGSLKVTRWSSTRHCMD